MTLATWKTVRFFMISNEFSLHLFCFRFFNADSYINLYLLMLSLIASV